MTTRDGIGAPRKREVVERDEQAMRIIRERQEKGLCTRLSDLKRGLDPGLSRGQVFYVFKRLQSRGMIERRAGYLWCIVDEG